MMYLSFLSFVASILYFYVGFIALKSNRKSEICKTFFLLNLSMAIWSFAGGFLYLAVNRYEYSFWNKVAAFGWCTFEAFVMYFVLVFTRNKYIKHWYVRFLVFIPAFIFLFMVLFLFGPDINTHPVIENIFYTGNFVYNFIYLSVSILLIYRWGHRSKSKIQKKQASIITTCSLTSFLLIFIFQTVLPALNLLRLPFMGQIFTLIMLWGVYYSIIRYQFMSTSTSLITYNLFNELTGLTILTNPQGYIIKANRQVNNLLNYTQKEMVGSHITIFLRDKDISKAMEECEAIHETIRFDNSSVPSKSGEMIPFHISIIPLYSKGNLLQGFLIIGEDIRVTKSLQDEIVKHKKTNEKLRNSEMLFRTLHEVTPISIILVSKSTGQIRYLNTRAEELLHANKMQLVGNDISEFIVHPGDRDLLVKSINDDKDKISESEILLRRKDGSQFIGLVTLVASIYLEEEVIFACIIDMTEQKRVEETLKQNNANISKLNNELMIMNDILANKSIKDGLTNLYNHQYMNEILEIKLQEISKVDGKLCVMMMDIDHFKNVNDTFGHQVGDQVLVSVAELITKNTRSTDHIGRYGGEEFIVILTDTDLETAAIIAERIRISIQEYDFAIDNLNVTISTGVVQYAGEIPHALINKADMLLYKAKSNGRNRVEK